METTAEWLVEDWYPLGHRVMDTAVEGSCKTMLGCWLSVCVALGEPFLGQRTIQGNVLMIDEETPRTTLEDKISRMALSFGITDYKHLPITIHSMEGFRFGRKTALDWLLKIINRQHYRLLRMDSVLAMLPGYRQGMSENDSAVGVAIKDDMDKILLFADNISISAHARKAVGDYSLTQIKSSDMQAMVRGSGSIVGEAADTGIVVKKLSEYPEPTRFVLVTKARRKAVPMAASEVYVELKEESYGKGWAKLERITPIDLPPTSCAKALFCLVSGNGDKDVSAEMIVRRAAFFTKVECKLAIEELIARGAVISPEAFKYCVNPLIDEDCNEQYLQSLRNGSNPIGDLILDGED